jgi:hypothetical protein
VIHRRRFLKLLGLGSLAATLPLPFSAIALSASRTASANGMLYRGDGGGRIYVSSDGGATWQLHTYLGPDYGVQRLTTDRRGQLRASIGYLGRTFELVLSPNLRQWLTS